MIRAIPELHYWTDLDMMIEFFKHGEIDRDYVLCGLSNMKKMGYTIAPPAQSPIIQNPSFEDGV